jgi:archaellum component FlaC
MKRHTLAGSVVVSLAIAVGSFNAVAASGQTLGEVAKKEADRRKAQPQGGKVYTNKDLPASAQKPATPNPSTEAAPQTPTDPVAAATEQKAEDAKAASNKPQGDQQKDQAYWKGRMSTAREELRRSEMFAEALQTRVNSLNKDFNSRDNPAQRSAIGADRTEALNELTRVKQEVERGKKQIADIEEEARKAGVPPGWVR